LNLSLEELDLKTPGKVVGAQGGMVIDVECTPVREQFYEVALSLMTKGKRAGCRERDVKERIPIR
jgi:hypothetical protein